MWKPIDRTEDGHTSGTFGELEVAIERTPDPLGFSFRITRSGETCVAVVRGNTSTQPSFVPAAPDLPILLVPASPVVVLPGIEYTASFSMPVWIQLVTVDGQNRKYRVADVPTKVLKKTWFGGNEAGEPAYRIEVDLSEERTQLSFECRVPFRVKNSSSAILNVERLLVRVIHLALFLMGSDLITNEVRFDFRGREQESRISFQKTTSIERTGALKVTAARTVVNNDIIKKSFLWIRDLTG